MWLEFLALRWDEIANFPTHPVHGDWLINNAQVQSQGSRYELITFASYRLTMIDCDPGMRVH